MINKLLLICTLAVSMCLVTQVRAQTFRNNVHHIIPGNGGEVYDTITVSALTPAIMNGSFGLDSVSLGITYNNDPDLIISLIAPDGTIVHLSDEFGDGANFTSTCFTMSVKNFANDASSPMRGRMQPSQWLGIVNNGQSGHGNWILRVQNTNTGSNTGTVLHWAVTFDATPAPPAFFTQSNLPIVVINTHDVVVPTYNDNDVPALMGIIDNGTGINHLTDPFNNYNGHIGMHTRGNSTQSFPTKSYDVTTEDSLGNDLNAPLMGLDADHSWALYAPWDDKSLIRDVLTYRLSNDMGDYASRTHLCELVMDGDYRGVYVLMDHIGRSTARVNVHSMDSTDTTYPNVSGGYIFEVDRADAIGYDSWVSAYGPCDSSNGQISFVNIYPQPQNLVNQQRQYLIDYVDSFETALKQVNLYDTVNGYRKYADPPSFIDQSLLQELGHNVDGYRLSSYLHKDRSSKLMGGPIWDFNEAYGNSDYYNGWEYNTWEWDLPCSLQDGNLNPFWWLKFLTDSNYYQELRCRYSNFRQYAFDTAHIHYLIDSLTGVLALPEQRHYTRWPILGVYTWPNYYVGNTYSDEINYLTTWLDSRVHWMDSQLYDSACVVPYVACDSLVAGFGYSSRADTFAFFDFSHVLSGGVQHWHWSFGDSLSGAADTSILSGPTHVFTSPGTYTVCEYVTGGALGKSCTDSICKTVIVAASTLGVSDIDAGTIALYPNPATSSCRITIDNTSSARYSALLVDISGRETADLGSISGGQITFSVATYSKGVYMVKIIAESGTVGVRKLVIE